MNSWGSKGCWDLAAGGELKSGPCGSKVWTEPGTLPLNTISEASPQPLLSCWHAFSLLREASFVILLSTSSSVPSVLCLMLELGLMSGKVGR